MRAELLVVIAAFSAPARGQVAPLHFEVTGYPAGSSPRAVDAADFDGNGRLDLIAAASGSNAAALLLAVAGGTFGPASFFPTGTSPSWVAAGDLDGNGVADAVVANSGSGDVSVLLGTGAGSFAPASNVAVGLQPRKVELADFDLDGDLDIASGNFASKNVAILLGQGDGQFPSGSAVVLPGATSYIDAGDLDGDGLTDLAAGVSVLQTVEFVMNQGGGAFALAAPLHTFFTGPNYTTWLALGDIDGDADTDLVITDEELGWGEALWASFKNDGAGTFCCIAFLPGCCGKTNELGDFAADGVLDHLQLRPSSFEIRQGLGTGLFSGALHSTGVGANPVSAFPRDIDQDGVTDVVTANLDGTVSVARNSACFAASIESVIPPTVDALTPAPATVTLTGCYLGNATAVQLDGVPLAPTEYDVLGFDQLALTMPLLGKLGPVAIRVITPQGVALGSVTVVPPTPPLILLATSGPQHLIFTLVGTNLKTGSAPGDVAFLAASFDLVPTVVPGIASFDIGNGGATLVHVSTSVVPAKGWLQQSFSFAGLPLGIPIHMQAGVFSLGAGGLPLAMSNVEYGVVAF